MTSSTTKRVAILGGGMAALTAAYELAKQNEGLEQPKYDITVYQVGWRLGGKGASGRNMEVYKRIEEHGLHIWFGAYANAFRLIGEIFGRQPNKWPFGEVNRAFHKQSGYYLMELVADKWEPWLFPFPSTSELPGNLSAPGLVDAVKRWLPRFYEDSEIYRTLGPYLETMANQQVRSFNVDDPELVPAYLEWLARPGVIDADDAELARQARGYAAFIQKLFRRLDELERSGQVGEIVDWSKDIRRSRIIMDVSHVVIVGAIREGVVRAKDWDVVNHLDLRAFVEKYAHDKAATPYSALVAGVYDLFFSDGDGECKRYGSFEAGTATRAALWLILTYVGAVMWRMNAGMGDTIFAPIYNALQTMNVKFLFFHKITSLEIGGGNVVRVNFSRQATVRTGPCSYNPLVQVKNIDCWPNQPRFEQLVECEKLRSNWSEYNLESDWSTWPGTADSISLGVDFDMVVLGIAKEALTEICVDIAKDTSNPCFGRMLAHVETVQTQAFQLWIRGKDVRHIRPGSNERIILTTFSEPIDTYADMTDLVGYEEWTDFEVLPSHIAYFCGVMKDAKEFGVPRRDPRYPALVDADLRARALKMLGKDMYAIWPIAYTSAQTFDWSLLSGGFKAGELRFDDQFRRANIDLTERYVVARPGTSVMRLRANKSGYANLFLTGDWTYNGLFVGCIEASVIAGKQAARALSGIEIEILGEGSLFKRP